jgi:hypothetical protein
MKTMAEAMREVHGRFGKQALAGVEAGCLTLIFWGANAVRDP